MFGSTTRFHQGAFAESPACLKRAGVLAVEPADLADEEPPAPSCLGFEAVHLRKRTYCQSEKEVLIHGPVGRYRDITRTACQVLRSDVTAVDGAGKMDIAALQIRRATSLITRRQISPEAGKPMRC